MSKVVVYTSAYNSEKTIRRTVDSILSQTHTDFIYYLLDNAATDNTGAIIKEYAKLDSRIVPLHNEINSGGNMFWDVAANHSDDCYFCMLDADDEYVPDFLEKMIAFTGEKELDLAICGSVMIDEMTGKLTGDAYSTKQSLILDSKNCSQLFSQYVNFMYTLWGKLYRISTIKRMNPGRYPQIAYGFDTLFAAEAFSVAERIGILAEPLHRYYISKGSISQSYDSTRVASTWVTVDAIENFLMVKTGNISQVNKELLYGLYFNNVQRAIRNILGANVLIWQKLLDLLELFTHPRTAELILWPKCRKEWKAFLLQVMKWVLNHREAQLHEKFAFFAGISGVAVLRDTENVIAELLKKEPLLTGIKPEAAVFMSGAAAAILRGDLKEALDALYVLADNDIPDQYAEDFLLVGLRLSSKLEYTDDFIFLKKLQILMLIEEARTEEAEHELADWNEIMPDDPDFKEFRKKLAE